MPPLPRRYLMSASAAFLAFGLQPTIAEAADGAPQNCFGPAQYNCYSAGDINPEILDANYAGLYDAYADLAWQDFLALNFPADYDTAGNLIPEPSSINGLGYSQGSYATVWETYTAARDLFQPDGSVPPPFGTGRDVPEICTQAAQASGRDGAHMMVSRISKAETTSGFDVLDEYIQANRMGPVVDQNGEYVRFAINFNKEIYDYVKTNTLYTPEGQEAFDKDNPNHSGSPVQWPRGAYTETIQEDQIGSIMVKAAWKILGQKDDQYRFHRVLAYVYNKGGGVFGQEPDVEESCSVELMGLVGFHIVHRTNSAPQWVWSTFEHIDNAPWAADFRLGTPIGNYSFFDPATCPSHLGFPAPSCAYNQVPDHPWNPERTDLTPTTIIRLGAPGKMAIAANDNYRNMLRNAYGIGGTVWENYFLVDVQFPTTTLPGANNVREVNPAYPDGLPTPTFLANSLIETYIQGFAPGEVTSNGNVVPPTDAMQNISPGGSLVDVDPWVDPWNANAVYSRSGGAQRNTSSCIGCHGDSAMTNGTFSNYVFSLSRAESPVSAPKPLDEGRQGKAAH